MLSSKLMTTQDQLVSQTQLLVQRLERLSADSIWAHRASGLRGSLLHWVERLESGALTPLEWQQLAHLVEHGFMVLTEAAREIPDPERAQRR